MNVAVVGGGYAGMAAAVTLAEAGVPVTVFEAAQQLGGRARRVVVNGVALDNGLHILIGAYRETLRLIGCVHPHPTQAITRFPLDWQVHERFRLKAAPLPAPLHLAFALLGARGAPWRERYAAARFMSTMRRRRFAIEPDVPVSELLAAHRQGVHMRRFLWEPLCVAALNTPPAIASAQVFLNVLREGLDSGRHAGDLLLARVDLSALFPEPAGEFVRARGGSVRLGHPVEAIERDGADIVVRARDNEERYTHVVCATSASSAAALCKPLPELAPTVSLLARLRFQPICSVYLQFAGSVRLSAPMLGLSGGLAHWVFDREAICAQRGLLAAVISAEGAHQKMPQGELARAVHAELSQRFGPLPPLQWHRVIAEKRATFECSVGLERPSTSTALPNVHLAGDFTASDHPATIEGAVRSGIAAARQVVSSVRGAERSPPAPL
jgi:hydroxysqualene dehydroxylase